MVVLLGSMLVLLRALAEDGMLLAGLQQST